MAVLRPEASPAGPVRIAFAFNRDPEGTRDVTSAGTLPESPGTKSLEIPTYSDALAHFGDSHTAHQARWVRARGPLNSRGRELGGGQD